jgi:hypothetical protein
MAGASGAPFLKKNLNKKPSVIKATMYGSLNKQKFTFLSNIRGGTVLHVAQLFAVVFLAPRGIKFQLSPFLTKKID